MKHSTQLYLYAFLFLLPGVVLPIYLGVVFGIWEGVSAFFLLRIVTSKMWSRTRDHILADFVETSKDPNCVKWFEEIKAQKENSKSAVSNGDLSAVGEISLMNLQSKHRIIELRHQIITHIYGL